MRTFAAVFLIAVPAAALAQTATPSSDRDQIAAIVQSQNDAWNRGDAEGFAAHYAEDGSFTNVIGQQIYGKAGFVAQHQRIFTTIYKGSHNELTVGHVQFVRPDVAVVDLDGVLTGALHYPPGLHPSADGAMHVKLQEVMSKENGSWTIRAFHNVVVVDLPSQAGGPPPQH